MKDQRTQARAAAARLINLARAGRLDTVVGSLNMLSYAGLEHRNRLRHILAALIETIAAIVLGRAGSLEMSGDFAADLRRPDESTVDIDALAPPVRAIIRAILAEVNEHPQDAADQLVLAVAGGQQATVDVVVLALRWAVDAVESCAGNEVPMPEWLIAS